MRRNMPQRQNKDIVQTYNSGVAELYRVKDAAKPGLQPVAEVEFVRPLRYARGVLGITRIYLARRADKEIRKVILIPKQPIDALDLILDHDGTWYEIDTIQDAEGVFPPSLTLALTVPTREVRRHDDMV